MFIFVVTCASLPVEMMMESTEFALGQLEVGKLLACIELMLLAAYSDGTIQDSERTLFKDYVLKSTEGRINTDALEQMLSYIERTMETSLRDKRLETIRVALSDMRQREAALRLAAKVVCADGIIQVNEAAFMLRAATALQVDPAVAARILDEVKGEMNAQSVRISR